MASLSRPLSHDDYTVACICPMGLELAAMEGMMDQIQQSLPSGRGQNSYTLGQMGEHNVVIAVMPEIGNNRAGVVATQLLNDFPSIRFGLLVGIGGGIPGEEGDDIRLGDVVVSKPSGTFGGVVQYDMGKVAEGAAFQRTGSLNKPPAVLSGTVHRLQAQHAREGSQIATLISEMLRKYPRMAARYSYQGAENDHLFQPTYPHQRGSTCKDCDKSRTVERCERSDTDPDIHYGTIGSGNALIKDGATRDNLREALGILCVEMEAAGLMDEFPCLVIRGICDYADSHKNKRWQPYAAAAAAGYAKELLDLIPRKEMTEAPSAANALRKQKFQFGLNLADAPDIAQNLFVGREYDLQQMEKVLAPQLPASEQHVLILGGLGGIGKTQIAISYAKRHRLSYDSVFWINATSESTVKGSMRSLATRVSILGTRDDQADDDQVRIRVLNWLSEKDNFAWLLIFDNYDDITQYDIKKFYPFASQGSIIITTRTPELLSGNVLHVEKLRDVKDSLRILATRTGRDGVENDIHATELADRLDGLPLALATGGAYLRQSSLSFAEYLRSYLEKWRVLHHVARELPEYRDRTLYTTWDMSFAQVERQDPAAAKLLTFLAYLDNQEIWYELLAAGAGSGQPSWFCDLVSDRLIFDNAMRTLVDFCLVEVHATTGTYGLHSCVHDWTLNGFGRMVDATQYVLAFNCVEKSIENHEESYLSSIARRPLAAHAARLAHEQFQNVFKKEDWIRERHEGMASVALLLQMQLKFIPGVKMYTQALQAFEKTLGPNHPDTMSCLVNFGMLYDARGMVEEAEKMWLRALAGYEKALEPNHPDTLMVVQNLGSLYHGRGKVEEAEEMWVRALAGYEKALEPDHPDTLMVVQNLGLLYHGRGKVEEAEKMWVRALAGYEKALEPDHPKTLLVVQNLGLLYHGRGKVEEAEKMWMRALAGFEKALGPDHPDTLSAVQNLGLLYHGRGRAEEAEKMWVRALAGYEKALEPDHPKTLLVVQNLGLLYHGRGKVEEAEKMWVRALAGNEKALEPDHPDTLMVVQNLGLLYHGRGRAEEAEKMWMRALAGYEKALGPDHPDTLAVVQNLGMLYHGRGKAEEAEKMWMRALAGYENALESEHPRTLAVVQNLGLLYHGRGKAEQAEKMWMRALAGYEKALEPDHPDTLMVVQNLGLLYYGRGKAEEAEKMWVRALAGYEKALESEHPRTLAVVQNLGLLYHGRGMAEEAEKMWMRALAGYEKALVPDHPDTLGIVWNLAILYYGRGKAEEAEKMLVRAIEGYRKFGGTESSLIFNILNCLTDLYIESGRPEEAEKLWLQALPGASGAEGMEILSTLLKMADSYQIQGRLSEAQHVYELVLQECERTPEPRNVLTLATILSLCKLLVERIWDRTTKLQTTSQETVQLLGDLIRLTSIWGSRDVSLFGMLGRPLIWYSDKSNAQRAFQQQVEIHNEVMVYVNVRCDGCGLPLTCLMNRFVCMSCRDIDVCGECLERHREGRKQLPTCVKHSFFEVLLTDFSGGKHDSFDQKTKRDLWLQNLRTEYHNGHEPKVSQETEK